jgi:outer membrane protein assembly factor BamB
MNTTATPEKYRDPLAGFVGWRLKLQHDRAIPTPCWHEGKLYVAGGFGSYDFYRVDAESGQVDWHYRTPDDGPTSAVFCDGAIVYNTESCTLEALRADGTPLWKRWLGDPLLGQPAAADGRVFAAYPNSGRHRIGAFSVDKGEELWSVEIGGDVITAPVAVEGQVFLTTSDGVVHVLEAETGRELWKESMQATSAPWVHDGHVFVAHREAGNVRRPGSTPPRERTSRMGKAGQRERSYAAKEAPYLDLGHGAEHKAARGGQADASVGFGTAPGAGKLHQTASLIGEAHVSRAWRFQGSRPVVSAGLIYDTSGDCLEARDVDTGEVVWSWTPTETVIAGERGITPPAVTAGKVYAATWSGRLICWCARTGKVLWQAQLPAASHWQPVVAGGWVFTGLEDGTLVGLNTGESREAGWPMWGGGPGHNGDPVTASAGAPQRGGRLVLPLKLANQHVFTDVNGRRFLVDTGSPISVDFSSPGGRFTALHASRGEYSPVSLPTEVVVRLRTATRRRLGDEVCGLIGMDFIGMQTVLFSASSRALTLEPVGGPPDLGAREIPIDFHGPLPVVKIRIGGELRMAIWDTGSQFNYVANSGPLSGRRYLREAVDFHPFSDPEEFIAALHEVPVEMWPGAAPMNLEVAVLPPHIPSGGYDVLGNALLLHYDVALCVRRRVMRLIPNVFGKD